MFVYPYRVQEKIKIVINQAKPLISVLGSRPNDTARLLRRSQAKKKDGNKNEK